LALGESLRSFLDITEENHEYCEYSAFTVYFGIALGATASVIFFLLNQQFIQNLFWLLGIPTFIGIIVVLIYRYSHGKFPFG
jgi:hypothetical protein